MAEAAVDTAKAEAEDAAKQAARDADLATKAAADEAWRKATAEAKESMREEAEAAAKGVRSVKNGDPKCFVLCLLQLSIRLVHSHAYVLQLSQQPSKDG